MKKARMKFFSLILVTLIIMITMVQSIAIESPKLNKHSFEVDLKNTEATSSSLKYTFNVKNTGKNSDDMENVMVRYWFDRNDIKISDLRAEISPSIGTGVFVDSETLDEDDETFGDTYYEFKLSENSKMLSSGKSTKDLLGSDYILRIFSINGTGLSIEYSECFEQTMEVFSEYEERNVWINGNLVEHYSSYEGDSNLETIIITAFVAKPKPTPTVKPTPKVIPRGITVDYGISISADKTKYSNGQLITYSIDVKNKCNLRSGYLTITANIPEYTEKVDLGGGTLTGENIVWKIDGIAPDATVKLTYKVKVSIPKNEGYATSSAKILNAEDKVENTEDDQSNIKVYLFKNNFIGKHESYIIGYPDQTFRPNNNVTRAEVATIFSRISGFHDPQEAPMVFVDVTSECWASGFIKISTEKKYFAGYPDGNFKPNAPITRAELAVVTSKYLDSNPVDVNSLHFNDISGNWASKYIEDAYRQKLISGYIDDTFKPNQPIKRSEMVTIVNKMLFRGPLTLKVSLPFSDLDSSFWAYKQIAEAATPHDYEMNENGDEISK